MPTTIIRFAFLKYEHLLITIAGKEEVISSWDFPAYASSRLRITKPSLYKEENETFMNSALAKVQKFTWHIETQPGRNT